MQRGEIYVVDLGSGVGREVTGTRAVVVVSNEIPQVPSLFAVVVPALGAAELGAILGVLVPASTSGFSEDLSVLARQPITLDASRFTGEPIGAVPNELMAKIDFAIAVHLNLIGVKVPRS